MPSEGSSHPLEDRWFLKSPWQPFSMPTTNSFVWSYLLPRLALGLGPGKAPTKDRGLTACSLTTFSQILELGAQGPDRRPRV